MQTSQCNTKTEKSTTQKLEVEELLPSHHRMHPVSTIWLKPNIRQVEGSEGCMAGPGTSLQNLLHRMSATVKRPRCAQTTNFMSRHMQIGTMLMTEANTCLNPSSHSLSSWGPITPNFLKQALLS